MRSLLSSKNDNFSIFHLKIIKSYRFRREELLSGRIETTEGQEILDFEYINQQDKKGLFPLSMTDKGKEANKFSNFGFLFNTAKS